MKNTNDQWFIYEESDLKLVEFTDSSFQSDHDDSKSMLGYIYILNNGAICWKSFKQHIVADFTYEEEYITASDAVKKVVWLQKFINELGVAPSLDTPCCCTMTASTIAQVKKLKSHQQTKHILCCYNLIWKMIDRGDVELQKINEKENLADLFTKVLDIMEFEDYKSKMNIRYYTDWL